MDEPTSNERATARGTAAVTSWQRYGVLALGAWLVLGFHDLALRHQGFRVHHGPPYGYEMPPDELAFYAFVGVFATAFAVVFAKAVRLFELGSQLETALRRAAISRLLMPALSVLLLLQVLLLKDLVLREAYVSDDEAVYVFIAKTLVGLDVKNPSPAGLDDHYRSTFVLMRESGWYGKYPIGHPLLLALGEAVGMRVLVVPLLAAASLWLTHRIARRVGGDLLAAGAAALLVASPQFVATAATELSQASSQLGMLVGVLFAIKGADAVTDRARVRAFIVGGAALGFTMLARPMPGAFFALVAFGFVALRLRQAGGTRWWLKLGPFVVPMALIASMILLVQWRQTGNPLRSGYQELHGDKVLVPATEDGVFTSSIAGSFVRQLHWAFGCPLVLLAVFFARVRGDARLGLLWAIVASGYFYRIASPKLFVGTTGPVYLAELVPVLAILVCVGLRDVSERIDGVRSWVAPLVVGGVVASLTMFWPIQIESLERNARPQRFVPDRLAEVGAERALVFANVITPLGAGESWALTPPPPSPKLDDRILYVRSVDAAADQAFWRSRHADRRAFSLELRETGPVLVELQEK